MLSTINNAILKIFKKEREGLHSCKMAIGKPTIHDLV